MTSAKSKFTPAQENALFIAACAAEGRRKLAAGWALCTVKENLAIRIAQYQSSRGQGEEITAAFAAAYRLGRKAPFDSALQQIADDAKKPPRR